MNQLGVDIFVQCSEEANVSLWYHNTYTYTSKAFAISCGHLLCLHFFPINCISKWRQFRLLLGNRCCPFVSFWKRSSCSSVFRCGMSHLYLHFTTWKNKNKYGAPRRLHKQTSLSWSSVYRRRLHKQTSLSWSSVYEEDYINKQTCLDQL